jgi:hypothetical protein
MPSYILEETTMEKKVAVPEVLIEDIYLNADNPFKKTMRWNHLKCKLCGEVILRRAITSKKDWQKVRTHLKIEHNIEVDEGVPMRLLSGKLFRIWLKSQMKRKTTWKRKPTSHHQK